MTDDRSVQSINRALDIVESLAVQQSGLSLTDIAGEVGLPKSTVYRIISTLVKRGYVDRNTDGNYKIGLKLIEAVSYHINSLELQTQARPYVLQIAANLGLTSHLGVMDGDKVVYIEKMDVLSSVKMYSQIGLRTHAYCSSLGKCMLSNYSKEELNAVMANCSFIKFTPNTIGSIEELHDEMSIVRKQGWAMDNEEYERGHRCIGAPIYDYRGDIIAAISASGDKHVLTDDRIESVAEYVKATALEISKGMGYVE